MICYNTLFNPTCNGDLHIGHALVALVNECEAHRSGGKFIVRLDDNQFSWRVRLGDDKIKEISNGIKQDFNWLGIRVDKWESQLETEQRAQELILLLNHGPLPVRYNVAEQYSAELSWSNVGQYPYSPYLTSEKVAMDWLNQINWKIRGSDLLGESNYYWHYCDIWGIPFPRESFIGRLLSSDGKELSDISKTKGGHKIRRYRDMGVSPADTLALLKTCCLKNENGEFTFDNLKEYPVLNSKEYPFLNYLDSEVGHG
jgi:glutamyl/glutaminyl-tRNA synthetase